MEIKTNNLILTKLTLGWWHGNRTSHGLEQEVAENQKGQADVIEETHIETATQYERRVRR